MHAGVPNAPFGGVGESGTGYYHGKYGFLAFTHLRTVVELPTWLEKLLAMRYPPYDRGNKDKLAVKNTLGFCRGETMQDQKLRSIQGSAFFSWRALMVAGMLGCVIYWLDDVQALKSVAITKVREIVT